MADNGSRTHEPNLREVTAELDGMRETFCARLAAIRELIDERDKRYSSKFDESKEAVRAALAAQKELTESAFKSSEKAISKAEDAQSAYNARSNEFRGQLEDQANRLLPKEEATARFRVYDEKIEEIKAELTALREFRSASSGRQDQQRWVFGLLGALGVAILAGLFDFLVRR